MGIITANGSVDVQGYSGVSTIAITSAVGGTAQVNALMVIAIGFVSPAGTTRVVNTVTDNAGNTWTRLLSQSASAGWDTTQTVGAAQKTFTQEIWYTKGATLGTAPIITITHDGLIDTAVMGSTPKFLGCDPTNPFDVNASLPKLFRVNATAAQTLTSISTANVNLMPLWFLSIWGTNLGVNNPTFNGVAHGGQNSFQKNNVEFTRTQVAFGIVSGPNVVGPYSNVTYTSAGGASNFFLAGLALTGDAAPPPKRRFRAMVIS